MKPQDVNRRVPDRSQDESWQEIKAMADVHKTVSHSTLYGIFQGSSWLYVTRKLWEDKPIPASRFGTGVLPMAWDPKADDRREVRALSESCLKARQSIPRGSSKTATNAAKPTDFKVNINYFDFDFDFGGWSALADVAPVVCGWMAIVQESYTLGKMAVCVISQHLRHRQLMNGPIDLA